MRLLQLTKEAGHSATLTFVVKGGKTRAKLEVDLDSEPPPPSSSTPASAPRPRRRRRCQARGPPQQGAPLRSPPPSLQEGEAGGSPRPPPQRPLKHLPAAPDGRRTLLHVPRSAMLSFAGLNMDGSPPCLPPKPPPPPPPALQNSPTLKVWRLEARNPDVDVELNSYPFKLKILVAATLLMGRDWMKASGVDLDNPP